MTQMRVKGSLVNGFISFIKRKWGIQGENDAMEYAGFSAAPKDGEFVDMKKAYRLLDWMVKEHGEEYVLQAGISLPKQIGGDMRFMLASVVGFKRILQRVPREISRLTFGGDSVKVSIDGKSAIVRLQGFRFDSNSCIFWKGVLQGVMENTKTVGEVVVAPESAGDDCVLAVKWD